MSPHFLTRWVSRLLGLALVSWAFARIGVHWLSLCLPYLSVLPFTLLYLPLDFIHVSSLRPTYLHPFGRPFTYSLFRWVSRLGTGSGIRWCGPRGGTAVRLEHIAAADVSTRLPRTPPFSRLLRHIGGYSMTILTPKLQGVLSQCNGPITFVPVLTIKFSPPRMTSTLYPGICTILA